MKASSAAKEQLLLWGFVLGLWSLLVLAFAGQLVFTGSLPWSEAIGIAFRDWVPWVVLGPLVAWLATRFPFERDKLAVSVPVHLVACMLALLASELLMRPVRAIRHMPPGGPPHVTEFPRHPPGETQRPPAPPPEGRPSPPPQLGPGALFVEAFARRAQFNLPVYWIIVSLVHMLKFYRRVQDRERRAAELETRLAEARLEALRMQLHPHFLFNTLNAISTLVHKDANAADDMIGNLSELLRSALDLAATQEISLREELELTERYLQIQQVRLGERLQVRREIDPAALDAVVPTMILQPLVENAVRHGIESTPGPGWVHIEARRFEGVLRIVISNSAGRTRSPAKAEPGIGLANTRARLLEMYGSKARLVLLDSPGADCSVELELPFCETAAPVPKIEGETT